MGPVGCRFDGRVLVNSQAGGKEQKAMAELTPEERQVFDEALAEEIGEVLSGSVDDDEIRRVSFRIRMVAPSTNRP
jgi:hypothetical protein